MSKARFAFWCTIGATFVTMASLSCAESAPWQETGSNPEVDSLFAAYMVDGSPGAAVMVIKDGEIIHARGYGLASLDDQTPLLPSTPFRLASVSKAFTAWAVVILEEMGELTFDSPVAEWVPELARFEGVTIRHLLHHTSGLPDYYGSGLLEGMATDPGRATPFVNADAIAVYETWGEFVSPPGDIYAYSNPGYETLALIVERVSGVTFGQFLDTHVFTPLGMNTAVVRERPSTMIPGRAIGYAPEDSSEGWHENDDNWANWLVGAGGVYASLNDLYAWDQALHTWAENGRLSESLTATTLNDGTQSPYGFGWRLDDRVARTAVHHDGGWVGFSTSFVRFPAERLTVIVLSNANGTAPELADAVAAMFLEVS